MPSHLSEPDAEEHARMTDTRVGIVCVWPSCGTCGEPGGYESLPTRADGREAGPLDRATFTCWHCGMTYDGVVPQPPEWFL